MKSKLIIKSSKWAKYANIEANAFAKEQIDKISKHFIQQPIGVGKQ